MRARSNEAAVCDVVVHYLEERCNLRVEDMHTTEKDSGSDPESRVDLRFRLGRVSYALEHTIVEPYEGEMRDWALRRDLTPDGYRMLPSDIDESSLNRFSRALDSKRRKLKRCQSLGMRTALALESRHIVHSPYHYAQLLDRVAQTCLDGMDSLYLVETGGQHVWYGWLLMSDGLLMRPGLDGVWPDPVIEKRRGD